MDAYFLSWQKFHPTLFGIPILVCSTETSTNKEIYEEVWRQTKRFVSTHQSERRNQSEKYGISDSRFPIIIGFPLSMI